jgi:hypothetical protein
MQANTLTPSIETIIALTVTMPCAGVASNNKVATRKQIANNTVLISLNMLMSPYVMES